MTGLKNLRSSLVGRKLVAAITGLILLLFLLAHMAGNLKALTGADAKGIPHIDVYAEFLRTVGEPAVPHGTVLWATRIILLISVVLHVVVVVQLAIANGAARPIKYEMYRTRSLDFCGQVHDVYRLGDSAICRVPHFAFDDRDPAVRSVSTRSSICEFVLFISATGRSDGLLAADAGRGRPPAARGMEPFSNVGC